MGNYAYVRLPTKDKLTPIVEVHHRANLILAYMRTGGMGCRVLTTTNQLVAVTRALA